MIRFDRISIAFGRQRTVVLGFGWHQRTFANKRGRKSEFVLPDYLKLKAPYSSSQFPTLILSYDDD